MKTKNAAAAALLGDGGSCFRLLLLSRCSRRRC